MQYRLFLIAGAMACLLPGCAVNLNINDHQLLGSEDSQDDAILAVVERQQSAWNSGDIDGFMQGYWPSPELRFASGGTVTTGWQETRDRYHQRYSNRALMGKLSFDKLEVDQLSDDAAIVHGQWTLIREHDQPWGLFTLVFKHIDGDWKIVSDTTTSAD